MDTWIDGGIYNLIINLPSDKLIHIGKLGGFLFKKGYYVYTGSAKKGLKARIERHTKREKTLHWHIDYLLEEAKILDVKTHAKDSLTECGINKRVFQLKGAKILAPGFGASDCNCKSHLAYFRDFPRI